MLLLRKCCYYGYVVITWYCYWYVISTNMVSWLVCHYYWCGVVADMSSRLILDQTPISVCFLPSLLIRLNDRYAILQLVCCYGCHHNWYVTINWYSIVPGIRYWYVHRADVWSYLIGNDTGMLLYLICDTVVSVPFVRTINSVVTIHFFSPSIWVEPDTECVTEYK